MPAPSAASSELKRLRSRLAVLEETLRAVSSGEVDTLSIAGEVGPLVFTLKGEEYAYRMLIESMNEGALTFSADKIILFSNACFARMLKYPLEKVTGSSFERFISSSDRAALALILKGASTDGTRLQLDLKAADGALVPTQISVRQIRNGSPHSFHYGVVVTDLTELRRTEQQLKDLMRRVVQVQEAESGRVANDLHDNITQLICAALLRSQALVESLKSVAGSALADAAMVRDMLTAMIKDVMRISQNLRPSILDQLGLPSILRVTAKEFSERTGIRVKLSCVNQATRFAAESELSLFRIFQEALSNVERHAHAHEVTAKLTVYRNRVRLSVKDDGLGFEPQSRGRDSSPKGELGLLSMRERATYVGGNFTLKSVPNEGTEIEVVIPIIA